MADETHLDEDAIVDRPETEVDADPFAALMNLVPESTVQPEPVEDVPDVALEAPSVAPVIVDQPLPATAEPSLESFLEAEFASSSSELADSMIPDPSIEDQGDVVGLDEVDLLNELDAGLSSPQSGAENTDSPPSTATFADDFSLEDMDLEVSRDEIASTIQQEELTPAKPIAQDVSMDLDEITLDEIDLTDDLPSAEQQDASSIEDSSSEIDIDLGDLDFTDHDDLSSFEDNLTNEINVDEFFDDDTSEDIVEEVVSEAPAEPLSPAIAAATSLSASDQGWLAAEPINQEAEIGHVDEASPDVVSTEQNDADPFLDLEIDLDLDADEPAIDEADLTDSEITNALRDAEVEEQIQSLDQHYAVPEMDSAPAAKLDTPVVEPDGDISSESASASPLAGIAAAGAVGLGLSKVFGGTAVAAQGNVDQAEPEPEIDDLDSVLGEIDNLDAPRVEVASDETSEIDIGDFTADIKAETPPEPTFEPDYTAKPEPSFEQNNIVESPQVPTVNIVEPDANIPETGAISVPHIDYDVPVEPIAAGPDEFEQAISDSFAEMQDDDLLGDTTLRSGIDDDLDIDLSDMDLDLEVPVSSEDAYQDVIANEFVADSNVSDPEFDALMGEGLDFNEDEIDGLRREAGHNGEMAGALPLSEITGLAAANESSQQQNHRKGKLIAACLVGVAVIAGIVGFGSNWFGNDTDDQSAMIIRSDTDNVKEVPTEPSGVEVANKDSEVFQGSATTDTAPDGQSSLVDNSEPLVGENSSKDLDRINPEDTVLSDASQAVEDAAQSVMTPRRVQTLVVRPDGTIAPASETPKVAEPTLETPVIDNEAERLLPSSTNEVGADIAAVPQRKVNTVTVRNNETPQVTPKPAAPRIDSQTTPDVLPIVPSRPANQPVNIVNTDTQIAAVSPERPAVTTPAAPSAPAGTYFVQIASTPSEADARATGNRLTSRFSSVFGGRGFVIRRAVIENKGTFYRVRVPGGTKNEAAALCSRYKSAGGSCFISR